MTRSEEARSEATPSGAAWSGETRRGGASQRPAGAAGQRRSAGAAARACVLLASAVVLSAPAGPTRAQDQEQDQAQAQDAITSILKELGVAPAEGGATPSPGSVFTEAQRAEIEAIVDLALAQRGLLPPDGVGTIGAPAADGALLDAHDPRALFAVLARFGPAEEGATSAGHPFVTGQMDGVRYRLDYFDCATPDSCRDVVFEASFDSAEASLDFLNAWNREHRYGVAGRDEDGSVWLRMPVNLFGGVSEANWSDTVDWWRIAAFEFHQALNKR